MNPGDALEILGNVLDAKFNAHQRLPNEYTKGELEGVREAYKTLRDAYSNPTHRQADSPLFTDPPVNPQTGQMIKYGDYPSILRDPVQTVPMQPFSTEAIENTLAALIIEQRYNNQLLEALFEVANRYVTHTDESNIDVSNTHVSNEELAEMDRKNREVEAAYGESVIHRRLEPKEWDQTLGQKLRDIQPVDQTPWEELPDTSSQSPGHNHDLPPYGVVQKPESLQKLHELRAKFDAPISDESKTSFYNEDFYNESESDKGVDLNKERALWKREQLQQNQYVDAHTGEEVSERVIGSVRFDDEYEEAPPRTYAEWAERQNREQEKKEERRTLEDWDQNRRGLRNGPYTVDGDQYGLQDLGPGEV
jgi:hypothetical protein